MVALDTRVSELIVEQLGVSMEEIRPEASFIDDLGADSLDIVELVMAMEEDPVRERRVRELAQRVADGTYQVASEQIVELAIRRSIVDRIR